MKLFKTETVKPTGERFSLGLYPASRRWRVRLLSLEVARGSGWWRVTVYLPKLWTAPVLFDLGRLSLDLWRGPETVGATFAGLGVNLTLSREILAPGVTVAPMPEPREKAA